MNTKQATQRIETLNHSGSHNSSARTIDPLQIPSPAATAYLRAHFLLQVERNPETEATQRH